MTKIGFACEESNSTPTLAIWLEGNGMGVQHLYCDARFTVAFDETWPGDGKAGGTGVTGQGFRNGQVYDSGEPINGRASISLRFGDPTDAEQRGALHPAESYKFTVEIDGCDNAWDPRVIPD